MSEPYKSNCCTIYHTCGCLALCGEVMMIAPHPAMANCCCQGMFPCLYNAYPGLQDAQALADFIKVAKNDFNMRKTGATAAQLQQMLQLQQLQQLQAAAAAAPAPAAAE